MKKIIPLTFLRSIDWGIVILTVLFVMIGVMTIYSSTIQSEDQTFLPYQRQLLFFVFSVVLGGVLWFVNYRSLKRTVPYLYVFQLLLLVLVLLFGVEVNGAKAWFHLGPVSLQPVELAKIIMILVLAKYFSEHYYEMHQLKHVLLSGFYMVIPLGLVLLQPDIGSALVLIVIWLGMLFVSNVRIRHFLLILLIAAGVLVSSWFTIFQDYHKERIQCLFQGYQSDTLCYNTRQALIAIGSGGLFGKGFGKGSQSQLHFLPEQHTDFIFAVLAEELGLVGGVLVLGLFGLLFLRLFFLAKKADSNFGKLIVMGILFFLGSHVVINIGMNVGLFPITGIPLPFLSYGGSMLMVVMISMGIMGNITCSVQSSQS